MKTGKTALAFVDGSVKQAKEDLKIEDYRWRLGAKFMRSVKKSDL